MSITGGGPGAAARRIVGELAALQLVCPQPVTEAVGRLSRWEQAPLVSFGRQRLEEAREQLVRAAAASDSPALDDDDLEAWRALDAWQASAEPFVAAVVARVGQDAALRLTIAAPGIYGSLRTAAAEVVAELEALPPAPDGVWIDSRPEQVLARTLGHERTAAVLAWTSDRFWRLARLADELREPAGAGFALLPDGAPRSAYVFKGWRTHLEREGEFTTVTKTARLWWAAVNGLAPGIWWPADFAEVAEPKRSRLGALVGVVKGA